MPYHSTVASHFTAYIQIWTEKNEHVEDMEYVWEFYTFLLLLYRQIWFCNDIFDKFEKFKSSCISWSAIMNAMYQKSALGMDWYDGLNKASQAKYTL